jgi:acyl-CoA dehydrogenase
MIPEFSDRSKELQEQIAKFVDEEVMPNENVYKQQLDDADSRWTVPPIMEEMKSKARAAGLWNLFLPESDRVEPMSNLDYSPLCEIMGRSSIASEVFNCSAPDTGNMEVFTKYADEENKSRWLDPLLNGEIRSAFLMTEPEVASSDATNIQTRIERQGNEYVINGRKWWSSGVGDPRCAVYIVMGKSDPDNADRYRQQSMIVVPADTPGMKIERMLSVFGYDDAPHGHGEVVLEDVRVPANNMLLGEGRGFEIAQGRLGPGRIHHCMRSIGVAERALEAMCKRAKSRVAFGKTLAEQTVTLERIANARIEIDSCRLLGSPQGNRHDQGSGPEYVDQGDRPRHATARRRRRQSGILPGECLGSSTDPAFCRRAG